MPATPRDLPVWTLAAASLRAGTPVALLCVVRSEGSSPGRQGFKMAVTPDEVAGSIGGGIMEHKWVELARQRLREADAAPLLRPQIHRREAPTDRSGMMCSGEQEVLLWPLAVADLATVEAIARHLQTSSPGSLSIGPTAGLQLHPAETPLATAAAETTETPFYAFQPGLEWLYRERLGFRDQLTIVGGGHVSLALSRVLAALDFELTVIDDRLDLPTLEANDAAHHRILVDYENVAAEIPAGTHRYVVVMTVGYRTDAVVLRQLLGRSFRYLGVMGSVAKVAELRRGLQEAGFSAQEIARLRGPIGLPIGSQTPEEIAISIAAELIQVRREAAQKP
ncbi:XdhC family protein [Hymenobacter armeniacus]|uniref:XdhC family protein n=1 Tax=Hymenobacter armeniacus TaxID=2771358 RepID=A0ABR8JSG2_9BACT|nr:XdhC/CoxI family protein [Hymenobacter armeniacus]MBD2721741.1 XdhC family protein [Hymenobacter armeniacus]